MHLFEPLFTTKRGGLGLGLYFVRMAVEDMEGLVSFKSRIDEGTTFEVSSRVRTCIAHHRITGMAIFLKLLNSIILCDIF